MVQVVFQDNFSNFPITPFESDFRRSIETRYPSLKLKAWSLIDPVSLSEIRSQDQFQRFCSSIKARHLSQLSVVLETSLAYEPSNPLFRYLRSVCALWSPNGVVGNGIYIGNRFVLVPNAHKSQIFRYFCVFRGDKEDVRVPVQGGFICDIAECESAVVRLNLTKAEHKEALEKVTPVELTNLTKVVGKGEQLICLHYSIRTPVLKETKCEVVEATPSLITVRGQLPDGSYGSPLFLPSGSLAGLLLATRSRQTEVFLRFETVILALISASKTIPDLIPLLKDELGKQTTEDIQLELAPNDEGNYSIGIEDTPFSPQSHNKQQSSAPPVEPSISSPQFSFDDGDVPPMPVTHQVPIIPKIAVTPYAHFLNPISGGTELWKLAKSEFSLRKETSDVELPRKCSSVDTQIGLVVTGGEDRFGKKVWIWGNDGVREVAVMSYPHTRHTSIQLSSSVFIISGDSTEQVERFDLSTISLSLSHPLPKRRYNSAVCAIGQSAMFLAGGYTGPQGKPSRSILEYRTHSDSWLKVGFKLTSPMAALGICFISPKSLLVIGGKNAQGIASAEAYIVDIQSGMKVASLHLPEPATFSRTQAVRDEESFIIFSDQTHQFEYDVRRQRFYLLSVS